MHAAGVVIGQRAIDEFVPLSWASDGTITTQFTMTTLEELGLLKMDFPGPPNPDGDSECGASGWRKTTAFIWIWKKLITMIKRSWSLLAGRTERWRVPAGKFGNESFMKELKPENLEDIIAGISLYRPGPMDFIPRYLKGKE